jgi:putative endonuclease
MFYVYVLRSNKDGRLRVGHTGDLDRRIDLHNNHEGAPTKNGVPYEIVYYEACTDKRDALRREQYLRGAYGKRYILNRLHNYLSTS